MIFEAALEQIEHFRDQHPGCRIAIVADHFRPHELISAFRGRRQRLLRRYDVRRVHQIFGIGG